MANDKNLFERFSSILKDFVATLRDGVLFILFVLLLASPSTVKERLITAGFTKGNIGGLEWEGQIKQAAEQTKTVGNVVSKADENYQTLIDRLADLEKNIQDPNLKKSLTSIGADAKATQADLVSADRAVKRSLSAQQAIIETVAPSSISVSGWLYLGKVTETKESWTNGFPVTIATTPMPMRPGMRLSIRDDAYWRADSPSGTHANAAILSVVKAGATVVVDEVDYSHAKGGGWFVWIKAHRAQP